MNNIYYLSHGGPGSGRYPLGSGDRPYQKFEGSEKKSKGIFRFMKSKKLKKGSSNEPEEDENTRKERVLKSGSASEVLKYRGKLTDQELMRATNRLRLENQLKDYSQKEIKSGLDTLKKIQAYSNVAAALSKDSIELWNAFASFYNTTPNGQNKPLTLVTSSGKNKK